MFQFSARANVSPVVAAMTMRQGACALELVDAVAAMFSLCVGPGGLGHDDDDEAIYTRLGFF